MSAQSPDPLVGTVFGDFEVVRFLGKGGMGVVYEARDLALQRPVALKLLLPELAEDGQARGRFQSEISHAVAIEHPNIVPVYTAGYEPPHFYIAMRLVRGPDLARWLRDSGAIDELRALRILGQVSSALYAMHEKGLVHRDVKPANVLLWEAGSDDEHAMLTDFGIAKAVDDTRNVTGMGAVGTPAYMAPEVCLGEAASPASDQYSLGCMAYELLSGSPPFVGDAADLRKAHVEREPVPLAQVASGVAPAVADAVDRSLLKSASGRHASVRDLVTAAKAANDAFDSSQRVAQVLAEAKEPSQAAARLSEERGLSDARISELTSLSRTEVVRLRRRRARNALVGRRPK